MDRCIWMYRGICEMNLPHQDFQWGGPSLFERRFDWMPDGRARFTLLAATAEGRDPCRAAEGVFMASTRRGWGQWNSQHRCDTPRDYITGATNHHDVLICPEDAARLGVTSGQTILLRADHGACMSGVARTDPRVAAGHVQIFWPAANDLIPHGVYDPASSEPDYNVLVRIEPAEIARR
jgi:anaerobic selenocysteine-containing dehydrogenase